MPLDKINKLKSYDEIITDRISEWEQKSISQIAKEIGKIGKMSKAEAEKYDAKKKTEQLLAQMYVLLSAMDEPNIKDIKKAYKQEFNEWEQESSALYDYRGVEQVPTSETVINAYASDTAMNIIDLTDTKNLCFIDGNGEIIRSHDEIYQAFSKAVETVTSGETDFYTAMKQTIKNLGGGVRVDYGDGVTRRLDTVVRQNLLYGIKKANIEYSDRIAKELNCDGYEIDAHNNSRDSHLFMQGKQYCIGEGRTINGTHFIGFEEADPESTDGLSASEALNDYGCRHYRTPIICGISEPRFTKEQLQKIKDDNTKIYEIDGKKGNRYFWSQKMRALETEIRKSKDEINALKAFGHSEPQIQDLQQRIKAFRAKYDQITKVTGIDKEPKRLTVQKPVIYQGD